MQSNFRWPTNRSSDRSKYIVILKFMQTGKSKPPKFILCIVGLEHIDKATKNAI